MKKLLIIFLTLLFGQFAYSQENINYAEIFNSIHAPTDEEIWQVVDRFNFTPEEKEQLFNETKKQMEELYQTQDIQSVQQRALQGKQMLDSAGLTIQDLMTPQQ